MTIKAVASARHDIESTWAAVACGLKSTKFPRPFSEPSTDCGAEKLPIPASNHVPTLLLAKSSGSASCRAEHLKRRVAHVHSQLNHEL